MRILFFIFLFVTVQDRGFYINRSFLKSINYNVYIEYDVSYVIDTWSVVVLENKDIPGYTFWLRSQ